MASAALARADRRSGRASKVASVGQSKRRAYTEAERMAYSVRARRPAGWLRAVERATYDQRRARAQALRERARELGIEAAAVLDAVGAARREDERQWCELGQYWDAYINRDHAGAPDAAVSRAITRWNTELAARANSQREAELAYSPNQQIGRRKRNLEPRPTPSRKPRALTPEEHALRATSRATSELHSIAPVAVEGFTSWLGKLAHEAERRIASTWHTDRAAAIESSFRRALTCNTETRGIVRCGCGASIEVRVECNNHWVCQHCRERRKRKYRRRFKQARTATMAAIYAANLAHRQTRAFFAERFLTLTMPRAESAEQGCIIIRKAWRLFWSRVRAALVRHYAGELSKAQQRSYRRLIRCVRAIEVAEGSDQTGHVHIHCWLVCPFIRAELLRAMWGQSLLKAGFPRARIELTDKSEVYATLNGCEWTRSALRRFPRQLFYPRLDIRMVRANVRRVRDGEGNGNTEPADISDEVVKYICKDLSATGEAINPALWAEIYRGLSSARIITATHGFWVVLTAQPCQQCGGNHWTLELAPKPKPRAQAPPLLAWCGS